MAVRLRSFAGILTSLTTLGVVGIVTAEPARVIFLFGGSLSQFLLGSGVFLRVVGQILSPAMPGAVAHTIAPSPTSSPTAASTPTTAPVPSTDSDVAGAVPTWMLIALLVLVTVVIVGMFALTLYNLSAPRSTLKNILGLKGHGLLRTRDQKKPLDDIDHDPKIVSAKVLESFGMAARVGKRTTRTTLAIAGFSLLGILLVAVFGLSGAGVRDLRSQVVASVTTLAAAIAGFYFGSESGGRTSGSQTQPASPDTSPSLTAPGDDSGTQFVVGEPGTYTPTLGGNPAPTVSLTTGALPAGLKVDPATGVITGSPDPGTEGSYPLVLTASNGVLPDAALSVTIVVSATR